LLGDVVGSLFTSYLLLMVNNADDTQIAMRAAAGSTEEDSTQDWCMRTIDLPAGVFSQAPFFSLSDSTFTFPAYEGDVTMMEVNAAGTVSPDGTRLVGLTLNCLLDGRDLLTIVGAENPDSFCNLAEGAHMPCVPCPTDDQPYCVLLQGDSFNGIELTGTTIEEIMQSDTHPDCEIDED
ncbi:MAG: hypothetical protein HN348_27630, partial [Proteobacteria bacterium]|nr:hypothetical protein [Pseudomonadota bacterium]